MESKKVSALDRPVIVSNTSLLICLANMDSLDLISRYKDATKYGGEFRFLIPQEVLDEVKSQRGRVNEFIRKNDFVEVLPKLIEIPEAVRGYANIMVYEYFTQYAQRKPEHHYPECIVIYHAKKSDALILIDESAAKAIAKNNGVIYIDHVSILVKAALLGLISKEEALRRFRLGIKKGNRYKNLNKIIKSLEDI